MVFKNFISRKVILISIIIISFILGLSFAGFIYFKGQKKETNDLGKGPDVPQSKDIEKSSTGSSSTSGGASIGLNPTGRVKEANDRRSQSDVRSAATGVQVCITQELANGVAGSTVYSSSKCADRNYLLVQTYLPTPTPKGLIIQSNKKNTKICIYDLNSGGSGIVSYDTDSGVLGVVGKGTTSCI